jgi:hypothetical protein
MIAAIIGRVSGPELLEFRAILRTLCASDEFFICLGNRSWRFRKFWLSLALSIESGN